jgi:hypothetical protein
MITNINTAIFQKLKLGNIVKESTDGRDGQTMQTEWVKTGD